jgi:hypothetical protein
MTTTVTLKRAEKVLAFVAEWMGTKGYGIPSCPEGRTLGGLVGMKHTDDDSWCEDPTFGPAPTGREAANAGLGPVLVMDWDWPGQPTPTIILEGGPDYWGVECAGAIQAKIDAAGLPLYVEPFAGYALSIYPN